MRRLGEKGEKERAWGRGERSLGRKGREERVSDRRKERGGAIFGDGRAMCWERGTEEAGTGWEEKWRTRRDEEEGEREEEEGSEGRRQGFDGYSFLYFIFFMCLLYQILRAYFCAILWDCFIYFYVLFCRFL